MSRPFATSRRRFLAMSGGAVATAAIYGFSTAPAWAEPRFPQNPFTLGVASGDPTPDGIVLWTRLAPEPQAADGMGGMPPYQVQVNWQVATDPEFRTVVKAGMEAAAPELAHSVHAEVSGLRPSADYWFRFRVGTEESPAGHPYRACGRIRPDARQVRPGLLSVLGRRPLCRLPLRRPQRPTGPDMVLYRSWTTETSQGSMYWTRANTARTS